MIRSILLLAAFALAGAPVSAQESPCTSDQTIGQCYSSARDKTLERLGRKKVNAETQKATTGSQASSEAGTTSAITDFLPRFLGAILTPGLDVDSQALVLKYNTNLGRLPLQFGVELSEAKLWNGLSDSIPETLRDSSLARLQNELQDEDDVQLSIASSIENTDLGRSWVPHLPLINDIVQGIVPRSTTEAVDFLQDVIEPQLRPARKPDAAAECRSGNIQNHMLSCYRDSFVNDTLIPALADAAEQVANQVREREIALAKVPLEIFSLLLNNQPQLVFRAKRHIRGKLVGTDEWVAHGRVERGMNNNLNWLERYCGARNLAESARIKAVSTCFQRRVARADVRERLERSQRFFGQIDFKSRDEFSLVLIEDSVEIQEPRTSELKLQLGYGQYFGELEKVARRPRVDADVSYTQQLEGDTRNDQLRAVLTYTRPFTDDLSAVFGFVWANKPEFVGDVTRKFGARLGVNYKLVNDDD